MVIKNYKLKENVGIEALIEDGFNYSVNGKYLSKFIKLEKSIIATVNVSLADFTLKVEVLDDDYYQYYMPFYEYKAGDIEVFDFLGRVITNYNNEMDKLSNSLIAC